MPKGRRAPPGESYSLSLHIVTDASLAGNI